MSTLSYGSNEWLALRDRVEQGRRNMEALTRLLPSLKEAPNGFLEGKEIKEAISLNIKVMNQVTEL